MSVGGKIVSISITDYPELVAIEVVDNRDVIGVFAMPYDIRNGPQVGSTIWWQGDKIYYDNDRRTLSKFGSSWNVRHDTEDS